MFRTFVPRFVKSYTSRISDRSIDDQGRTSCPPTAEGPTTPPNEPLVISFVGASGSGKTTVIEQLVPLLRREGLSVGTVKHAPHGFDADRNGSDSWRHQRAGADVVLLAGAGGAAIFLPAAPVGDRLHHGHAERDAAEIERLRDLVLRHLPQLDVVLVEGFAPIPGRLVEVRRTDVPPKRALDSAPWRRVTDRPTEPGVDMGFDAITALASAVVELVRPEVGEPPPNHGT